MFRKAVIVLLLLVTPLAQARAVLICAIMNGQEVQRCVCPGEQHRLMTAHDDAGAACCMVVLEISERQIATPAAEQSARLSAKHRWDTVPVIAIVPSAPISVATAAGIAPPPWLSATLSPASSRLYLRTARLRL